MVGRRLVSCVAVGLAVVVGVAGCWAEGERVQPDARPAQQKLEWVRVSDGGADFVSAESGGKFVVWGVNYDHDHAGRLLDDYWESDWPTVVEDFGEIKALGANVVRLHLQLARIMRAQQEPDPGALKRLARLVARAEDAGLYLDITGLGCYHKKDVPRWYDALDEAARWGVQALFWESVARTCAESPAVFCYDLMNEPVLPGANRKESEWLLGEFGGKHFVQRITLDLAGRPREQVAKAWVGKLVAAIRRHDNRHLITVGVIPWAHVFPKAKPLFHSKEVGGSLDFVSVHFYPRKGEVDKALAALAVYDTGKPLVVEEMFPLKCSIRELDAFVDGSRKMADGYMGFYWGRTAEEYKRDGGTIAGAITQGWLEYFRAKAPRILSAQEQRQRKQ